MYYKSGEHGGMTLKDIENSPQELLSGTSIYFKDFHVSKDYCFCFILYKIRYTATFYIEGHSPDESYTYTWGKGLYLHRAPWENEDTPEWRYIGFNGRSYRPDKEKHK